MLRTLSYQGAEGGEELAEQEWQDDYVVDLSSPESRKTQTAGR
jgi:hypothetical protein